MDGTLYWIVALSAAVCIGLGKGGVPVITALAVPLMALVTSPIVAAGVLAPVLVASDVLGLITYRKVFHRNVLMVLTVAAPLGILIGYLTVDLVSDAIITLIIGLIGLSFALSYMIRRPVEGPPLPVGWGRGAFWGPIIGFTAFVSHAGGVPYQVYAQPLRLDKLTFAGTMVVSMAYINIVKLIPYYALGQLNGPNMQTAAILMIPAAVSVYAGVWLVRVVSEQLFFRAIVWALLAVSVKLLFDGVRGL